MKALVLEVHNGTAAALREDGTVVKVRRKCEVGQTIELGKAHASSRWILAVAAMLALILLGGGVFTYDTFHITSYVSLDAGTSVEYALNRSGNVVSVEALSSDAEQTVRELTDQGIRGTSLEDAISQTLELLGNPSDGVLISVTSGSEARQESLTKKIQDAVGNTACVVTATMAERRDAAQKGISPGRYKLIQEIAGTDSDSDSNAKIERYKDTPVDELLKDAGKAVPASAAPAASQQPEAAQQPAEQPDTSPSAAQPEAPQPSAVQQPASGKQPAASQQSNPAQNAASAKQPAVSQQPAATGKPDTAKQPASTGKPDTTKQPAASQQPASSTKPDTTKQPASSSKPDTTKQPASTGKPDTAKQPASSQQPASTGKPDTAKQPAASQQSGASAQTSDEPQPTAEPSASATPIPDQTAAAEGQNPAQ